MSKVLVTGGAGYIGSHTLVELLQSGNDVVVLDNLSNSSEESLRRVEQITGQTVSFYQGDILDDKILATIFAEHQIGSVVHFAGLKAVGESVAHPIRYYQNNVTGTLSLCNAMAKAGVFNLVFSSSATVYGDPASLPIKEDFPVGATTNPYGTSKYMVERVLQDLYVSDNRWNIAILRYFNPVGAHESGLIGEDPNDIPNNLMPFISQVAVGKRPQLAVFGNDYDTVDGTGVRDYIHVVDLAIGHLKALDKLQSEPGVVIYNLGTGIGYSVLQMVQAFEQGSGQAVPYQLVARRPGDIAACYADPKLAEQELGWKATRGVAEMTKDTWRWQSKNPNGYSE
ncbi:UDP-glucose 4-epimerase GalE [uncultured Ferrimonas sp.]|uniref:UDP-glucose 4-epimerase GalE n=1 Tax=uncultured Ferrimonas sp. TaxID=432640 RepID=UPI00263270F2|nr:UDP-glucose 4-epimerase GalE [uncultured Ferrimonas sp.]